MSKHFLEVAAQAFADATARPPFVYELGPDGARKVLDDVQAAPIAKPEVADKWITVAVAVGDVRVRIVKPAGATGMLPNILYMHGGGWVLGNAGTHDRLVRELAVGVNAAVAWFWNAYLPDRSTRAEITASPLRASTDQLTGLPDAFVIVDENDVLRDEGEAYARKLTAAGVRTTCVRYNGILHDFMMLNPLRQTAAATGAIEQAIHVLRKALHPHRNDPGGNDHQSIRLDQPLAARLAEAIDALDTYHGRLVTFLAPLVASGTPQRQPTPEGGTGVEPRTRQVNFDGEDLRGVARMDVIGQAVTTLLEPEQEHLRLPAATLADAFLGLNSGRTRTPHPEPSRLPTEQPRRSQLPAEQLVDLFMHGALTTTNPASRTGDGDR